MFAQTVAMLVDGYDLGYNAPTAAVVVLAAANAMLGAGFSAAGMYLLTLAPPEFSYTTAPVGIVVLGLATLYAAGVAAAGVVSCSLLYTRATMATAALLMLGEIAILIYAAHDPLSIRAFHESSWRHIHGLNPLALQRYEHMYGCCGFVDRHDMPSHARCAQEVDGISTVKGCEQPLAQATFHIGKLALRWCSAALVTQVLILVGGSWFLGRARLVNTLWDVDIGVDDDEGRAEGGPEGGPAAVPAAAPAAVPEALLVSTETAGDNVDISQPLPLDSGPPEAPHPSPVDDAAHPAGILEATSLSEAAGQPTSHA